MTTTCPVCSYLELVDPPWTSGSPSDEICPRCGTHFGYDDAIGLRDAALLPERHAELRQRWVDAGSHGPGASLVDGVPVHLQPEGPFAALLPKSRPITPELVSQFQAVAAQSEQLLSEAHIAAIDVWFANQPDERPETQKARAPELNAYVRQVAATTILNGSEPGVERLAKAAFVMGAWIDDPRETGWRLLHFAAQAAVSLGESPAVMLTDIARRFGPVSAAALQRKWRFIERMPDMPVTRHQPSGLALLEPAWDAEENAKRLGLTAWLLGRQTSAGSLPWDVPSNAYADAGVTATPDGFAFVDALNRFLISGSAADASQVVADAVSIHAALPWAVWAASYWHGGDWPSEFPELVEAGGRELQGQPNGGLVAIARGGTVQVSWTLV